MRRKIKEKAKYTAMSKLIGIIIGLALLVIICFSMVMIAITKDLSPITTLIAGVFGLASAYVAFYLTMAKAEHIEDKKNQIKKQLEDIKSDGIITKEEENQMEQLKNNLENIDSQLTAIEEEPIDPPSIL